MELRETPGCTASPGICAGIRRPAGDGGGRGGRGAEPAARQAEDRDAEQQEQEQPQGFGRGPVQGPVVPAGRYRVALAHLAGTALTPVGTPQTLGVIPLPR